VSLAKVQKALLSPIKTAFAGWGERVAWENVHRGAGTEPWMSVSFMPADERTVTLGAGGKDRNEGLLQVTLFYPAGKGEGTSRETIEQLRTCFSTRRLQYEGQDVLILGRYRGSGRSGDDWYQIPFTIRWQADIPRNP